MLTSPGNVSERSGTESRAVTREQTHKAGRSGMNFPHFSGFLIGVSGGFGGVFCFWIFNLCLCCFKVWLCLNLELWEVFSDWPPKNGWNWWLLPILRILEAMWCDSPRVESVFLLLSFFPKCRTISGCFLIFSKNSLEQYSIQGFFFESCWFVRFKKFSVCPVGPVFVTLQKSPKRPWVHIFRYVCFPSVFEALAMLSKKSHLDLGVLVGFWGYPVILLMVQKSNSQPPGILKTLVNNGMNSLSTGERRISSINNIERAIKVARDDVFSYFPTKWGAKEPQHPQNHREWWGFLWWPATRSLFKHGWVLDH